MTDSGRSLLRAEIDLSGPFFTRDPRKTVKQNIRRLMEALAEEGERNVKGLMPQRTGETARGVVGRVENLRGKRWAATLVVSQTRVFPWVNKGARGFVGRGEAEYRGGKLEARHHMFRKTASAMRRSRKILAANLTEGLE